MGRPARRQSQGYRAVVAFVALWVNQKIPAFALSTRTDEFNDIPRNRTLAQIILDDESFLEGTNSHDSPVNTVSKGFSTQTSSQESNGFDSEREAEESVTEEKDSGNDDKDSVIDDNLGESNSKIVNSSVSEDLSTSDVDEEVVRQSKVEEPILSESEEEVDPPASEVPALEADKAEHGSRQDRFDANQEDLSFSVPQLDDREGNDDSEIKSDDRSMTEDVDSETMLPFQDEIFFASIEDIIADSEKIGMASESASTSTPDVKETVSETHPDAVNEVVNSDTRESSINELDNFGDISGTAKAHSGLEAVSEETLEERGLDSTPDDDEATENEVEKPMPVDPDLQSTEHLFDGHSDIPLQSEAPDISEEDEEGTDIKVEKEAPCNATNCTSGSSDVESEDTADGGKDPPFVGGSNETAAFEDDKQEPDAAGEEKGELSHDHHVDETLIDFDQIDGEPTPRPTNEVNEISTPDSSTSSSQTQRDNDAAPKDPAKPGSLADFFQKVSDHNGGNDFHQRAAVRTASIARNDFMQRSSEQSSSERVYPAIKSQGTDERASSIDPAVQEKQDDLLESNVRTEEYPRGGKQQSSMWGVQTKDAVPSKVMGEGFVDVQERVSAGAAKLSHVLEHEGAEGTASNVGIDIHDESGARTSSLVDEPESVATEAYSEVNPESMTTDAHSEADSESVTTEEHLDGADNTQEALPEEPISNVDPEDEPKQPSAPVVKSVNTEFVEGLDDINKFLEEVDPPDELDVGAAGSSIQEVLMGQGAQIVTKRVVMGVNHIRRNIAVFGGKAKERFEVFATRFKNKDGKFAIAIRQEQIGDAAKRIGKLCLRGLRRCQDFLDELLFGDDEDDDSDFGEEAAKLANLRELIQKRPSGQRLANSKSGGFNKLEEREAPRKEENIDVEQFIRQKLG